MSDFDSHSAWRTEGDEQDGWDDEDDEDDEEGDARQFERAHPPLPPLPMNGRACATRSVEGVPDGPGNE